MVAITSRNATKRLAVLAVATVFPLSLLGACGEADTTDPDVLDAVDDTEVGRPDTGRDAPAELPDTGVDSELSDEGGDVADDTSEVSDGASDGSGDAGDDTTSDATNDTATDVASDTAPDVVVPPGCGNGRVESGEQCDDGNEVDDDTCSNACISARCGDAVINRTEGAETFVGPVVTGPGGVSGYVCDDGSACPEGACDVATNRFAPEHGICQALGFDVALSVEWGGGPGTGVAPMHHASNWSCFDFSCEPSPVQSLVADCAAWEMLASISCEGIVGEECDDGDAANGDAADACRADCTLPFCGDGITDSDEECDDGNAVDDDGCSNGCLLAGCGDGIRNGDEECDDGNDDDTDSCRNSCVRPRCGDGFVSVYERSELVTGPVVTNPFGVTGRICDDGASCEGRSCSVETSGSAPEHGICQALGFDRAISVIWGGGPGESDTGMPHAYNWSCASFVCGPSSNPYSSDNCSSGEMLNSITCFGGATEECDLGEGNSNEPDSECRTDCREPYCGDGIADSGEECDDGNLNQTDGCSTLCLLPQCGDGVVQSGEQCDDGNESEADFCLNDCRNPVCGDGILSGSEQCDAGAENSSLPDAECRLDCRNQRCGDAVRDTDEACDDGNTDDRDLCTNACDLPVCGDGIRQTILGEECDDGNLDPGDGCDLDCLREAGSAAGQAIYVGHDYFARAPSIDRIAGNIIAMADRGAEVNVLGYVEFADGSASGEVANINAAINSLAGTLGYTVRFTTFSARTALAGLIDAADVLLIYEQESANASTMAAVGTGWRTLLLDFVARGGIVAAFDYSGDSWALMNAAGMISIASSATIGTDSLTLPDVDDPLIEGVTNPYAATNGSRDVTLAAGSSAIVVARTPRGTAVLVRQEF
jgi:cysteine-rich repeat protein